MLVLVSSLFIVTSCFFFSFSGVESGGVGVAVGVRVRVTVRGLRITKDENLKTTTRGTKVLLYDRIIKDHIVESGIHGLKRILFTSKLSVCVTRMEEGLEDYLYAEI